MPYKDNESRKEYMREWTRLRREDNRNEMRAYKVEQGCKDCGYKEHHAALEFDHVSDDKYHNVSSLLTDKRLMWLEIAKCEVVCSNCHSIRTHNRRAPLE